MIVYQLDTRVNEVSKSAVKWRLVTGKMEKRIGQEEVGIMRKRRHVNDRRFVFTKKVDAYISRKIEKRNLEKCIPGMSKC